MSTWSIFTDRPHNLVHKEICELIVRKVNVHFKNIQNMESKKILFVVTETEEELNNLTWVNFLAWRKRKRWSNHMHLTKILKKLKNFPGDENILARMRQCISADLQLSGIFHARMHKHFGR